MVVRTEFVLGEDSAKRLARIYRLLLAEHHPQGASDHPKDNNHIHAGEE
jgi:hypothetical protein